ncbi:MAG: arginine deiminase-related protein [Elusimicrobiota bacterium]
MNTRIYHNATELKGFSIKNCPSMPPAGAVLMCEPKYYTVSEGRNPYMKASIGKVDTRKAQAQWEDLRDAFKELGCGVSFIEPVEGFEDMVFTAHTVFTGLSCQMDKICVLGQMRHPARRGEVAHFAKWFRRAGYRVIQLKDETLTFEGAGDCLWHPGKRLLWGGYGFRTDLEVYPEIAQAFEAPVIQLKLVNERFYHLSTCFCPLTHEAVLVYPSAFAPESLELILKLFPIVLAAEELEAAAKLPCSAAIVDSTVLLQKGAATARRQIKAIGLKTRETETSEFIKSGGSSHSLKMHLY